MSLFSFYSRPPNARPPQCTTSNSSNSTYVSRSSTVRLRRHLRTPSSCGN